MVFLSLASSLVFALPADAGEKMGLSITVLLAYAVYLTLITDAMPNTSMQVSTVIEGEGVCVWGGGGARMPGASYRR